MEQYMIQKIGEIRSGSDGMSVVVSPEYIRALEGLEGFSHIQVIWWFSGCDNESARNTLTEPSPYRKAPSELGTFATRSPMRPNPIALSCAGITYLDRQGGVIGLDYIDADDGSPVLDIKPYTPSLDRVEWPCVPEWCAHWPKRVEASGDFDWASEFTF